jgi:hypothetical protein
VSSDVVLNICCAFFPGLRKDESEDDGDAYDSEEDSFLGPVEGYKDGMGGYFSARDEEHDMLTERQRMVMAAKRYKRGVRLVL